MSASIQQFLRTLSDDEIIVIRDKIKESLLENVRTTSVSVNGKSWSEGLHIEIAELARQLVPILEEREIDLPEGYVPTQRLSLARF